jgi:hypothetical protein
MELDFQDYNIDLLRTVLRNLLRMFESLSCEIRLKYTIYENLLLPILIL